MNRKLRIAVGLPVYKPYDVELYDRSKTGPLALPPGLAHPATFESFYKTVEALRGSVDFSLFKLVGCGCLDQARAILLGDYLALREQMSLDYYWMLDADLSWEPEDLMALLLRDKDLVGATYPIKTSEAAARGQSAGRGLVGEHPKGGLLKVQYLAGGFMLLKDEALYRMCHAHRHLAFRNNPPAFTRSIALWATCFAPAPEAWNTPGEKELLSEDYAFCARASDAGIDRWLDMNIRLAHWQGDTPYLLPVENAA